MRAYKNIAGLLLVLFTFSISVSCSKNEDEITLNQNPVVLTTEKENYSPYEIVTIVSTEAIFNGQMVPAMLNNQSFTLQTHTNSAAVALPNLPNGDYVLSFSQGGKLYNVNIKVLDDIPVVTANFINTVNTEEHIQFTDAQAQTQILEDEDSASSEYSDLQDDYAMYNALISSNLVAFNALSDADKIANAKFVMANKEMLDEFRALVVELKSSVNLLRVSNVQDYENLISLSSARYLATISFAILHIPAYLTACTMAVANPLVGGSAAFIIALSFFNDLSEVCNAIGILVNRIVRPFQDLAIGTTVYNSGVEVAATVSAKYKSLVVGDENGDGTLLRALAGGVTTFKNAWNDMRERLPAALRPSYIVTGLKSTFNEAVKEVHNQYVSFTNISNPTVTLQQINQADGSIKVKAMTTATTNQNFTYKINYNNGAFNSNLSATVNAQVLVEQTFNYAGNWTIHWFLDGAPYEDNRFTCGANGVSTSFEYMIPPGGWLPYDEQDGITMSYYGGQLHIYASPWGNHYVYSVNSVDDTNFNSVGGTGTFTQVLVRN